MMKCYGGDSGRGELDQNDEHNVGRYVGRVARGSEAHGGVAGAPLTVKAHSQLGRSPTLLARAGSHREEHLAGDGGCQGWQRKSGGWAERRTRGALIY